MLKDGPGGGAVAADGPFSHYAASPSTIYSHADAITKHAGDLTALRGDITSTHRPAEAGVAGILAGPMKRAPKPVKHNATHVMQAALVGGACVTYFGDSVTKFNAGVDKLNAEYAAAKADDFGVTKPSKPTGKVLAGDVRAVDSFNDLVADAKTAKLAELKQRYANLEDKLDARAKKTATMLHKGPDDEKTVLALFGAGVLSITAAVEAFPTVDFSRAKLSKEQAEALGRYLAARARALLDGANGGWQLDKQRIRELKTLLVRLASGNAEVNAQFINALGGKDTLLLIAELGSQETVGEDERGLAALLRVGVNYASTTLPSPDARKIADDFVDAIKEWNDNYDWLTTTPPPSTALSFILQDPNRFGTAFLDTLGDRLDEYERTDPNFESWKKMANRYKGDELLENLFVKQELTSQYDPMSSYMSALGKNGVASLQFFTEGEGRQQYWIQERSWGDDDFNGLLSALDSATTDERNLGDRDASDLVAHAVHYLTSRDDDMDGLDRLLRNDEGFQPGDIGSSAARHLAHMIGTYMASVDYAVNTDHSAALDPDEAWVHSLNARPDLALMGFGDMPVFQKSDLRELFETALSNEDGFMAMREVVSNYQNQHISATLEHANDPHFFTGPNPDAEGTWSQAMAADAGLEGFLLDQISDEEIGDGIEKDEQVEAWIGLGQTLAGTVPVHPGLAPLTQSAIDLGGMELEDALATHEVRAAENVETRVDNAIDVRRAMIVKSLYDPDATDDDGIVILQSEVKEAADSVELPPDEYQRYFGDGRFPTQDELRENQRLRDVLTKLANDHVSTKEWRQSLATEYDAD